MPLIFRVIKKNKSRRRYKCLSSGAALRYNEFYPQNDQVYGNESTYHEEESACSSRVDDDLRERDYRRYDSVKEFSNGLSLSQEKISTRSVGVDSKELVNYNVFSSMNGNRGVSSVY